ncbi:nitrate reductase subunit beta [Anaeromyxobacter oryzisoli]|uniref:nitrate reductase subunit beta n=1 Tax=Anaeromyxobacter oryzisoli TaxID=2925408 RepID=UPI0024136B05|nr:nitrate reductase subunit beta [Anaeromyxobacter sp. SG63]
MDVRAQISMVFHLDKCIGCHTCSIACKNLWTDRRGAEYMWWNNVETKPGTGYPTLYEDQARYRGGWRAGTDRPRLALGGRASLLARLFHNPRLPALDDYYEPWTYRYEDLLGAPPGDEQPVATPVSLVTGEEMEIEAGPNWDDDLGGSGTYALNDPCLAALTEEERARLLDFERLVFFYLPRICNHCLNPGCLGACPAGAIAKRGEDGIVLVNQEKCRGWRMCVSGCPYKKTYFNWSAGKAEKCILCYPRQETQQVPACMHSCVGRIRYLGVLLYDAGGIARAASLPAAELVEAQRALVLDPSAPDVVAAARASGVPEHVLDAAGRSPVYAWVKRFRLALPHHPEFRTLPMLFYVPPLLPVMATTTSGRYEVVGDELLGAADADRLPLRYLAALFTAGEVAPVAEVYRRLVAVRLHHRAASVGDVPAERAARALAEAGLTAAEAEEIYRLGALASFDERFVIPPFSREAAIAASGDVHDHQEEEGAGFLVPPRRGW